MTSCIQILVYVNNKLLMKFINKNDPHVKGVFHEQHKTYRNNLYKLMKESKQKYYTKLFEKNRNNIKNAWKGDIFNMSFSTGQFPSVLKIAKVMPIHKDNQKLIIQIIDQYASYLIFF